MSERRPLKSTLLKAAIQLETSSLGLAALDAVGRANSGGVALGASVGSAIFVKVSGDLDRRDMRDEVRELDIFSPRPLGRVTPQEEPRPSRVKNVMKVLGSAAAVAVGYKVGAEIHPLMNLGLCAALPTTVFTAQCINNRRN